MNHKTSVNSFQKKKKEKERKGKKRKEKKERKKKKNKLINVSMIYIGCTRYCVQSTQN